jgi:hypothetical protein
MNEKYFKIGDWVKAKSVEGELVIGYIERLNEKSKTAKIKVVQAEQASIAGRTIETLIRSVSALQPSSISTKDEILGLIDLALFTRDEKWFLELTNELSRYEKNTNKVKPANRSAAPNRLNFPHVK